MSTQMKVPQVANKRAKSGDGSKTWLLRTGAIASSAVCIVMSLVMSLLWADLYISLVLGVIGVVLAAWDARTPEGKSAGRQVLVFSIVALMVVPLVWVAVYRLFLASTLFYLLASILGLGAVVALYLAGHLHEEKPNSEREQAEISLAIGATQQSPRLLLAVAALVSGLSIAIPAVMMAIVYPLNGAQYYHILGEGWVGDIWWPLVFAAIALSIWCGIMACVLAVRTPVSVEDDSKTQSGKAPHWVARRASGLLGFALLALILAPIMGFKVTPNAPYYDGTTHIRTQWISPGEINTALGAGLIGLGLACVVLAVWGVTASNPASTRRWLRPFAVVAFVLALLGNAYTFLLFAFIGFSL